MKRTTLLITILASYAACLLGLLAWAGEAWSASAPDISLAVKGASTGELDPAAAPRSAPYPVVVGTPPPILAREYALYNAESGKVIFRSQEMPPVPIASTTKLMTTYLVATRASGHLQDVVSVTPEAAGQTGSLMTMAPGERLTVEKLMYGALLVSGNDAAYQLAEFTGGLLLGNPAASEQEKIARFVQEMNSQAGALHMLDTHYQDPVGLNDQGHSTAVDLAKLASVINGNPILSKIIGTPTIALWDEDGYHRYDLRNSNRILTDYQYDGVLGGKTGFTDAAGHCLVTSARRNGITLTAVVLHTDDQYSTEASALESRKLLDAGFSLVRWQ